MTKGIIVFYINFLKEDFRDPDQTLKAIRDLNKVWIEKIEQENEYAFMVVPTFGEASRVDKVDFGGK
jgi:hypothetical protein